MGRRSTEAFVEELKKVAATSLAGNAQLAARLNNLIRKSVRASGGGASQPLDPSTLLSRWLDFNLASYSIVTNHSVSFLNSLLGAAEEALLPGPLPDADTGSKPEPRVELRLEGRPGDRVSSGFLVENHFDRPLDVAFESDDLSPGRGAPLPSTLIEFEPPRVTIPPRGQNVVQAAVAITPDFVVGQTYATTIRLLGFNSKELGLSLTVLPGDKGATPSAQPRKKTRPAGKRRHRPSQ
ncbi:MAG: hypothetical protein ACREL3_10930 [Gemmatimonadales bacterium]